MLLSHTKGITKISWGSGNGEGLGQSLPLKKWCFDCVNSENMAKTSIKVSRDKEVT